MDQFNKETTKIHIRFRLLLTLMVHNKKIINRKYTATIKYERRSIITSNDVR